MSKSVWTVVLRYYSRFYGNSRRESMSGSGSGSWSWRTSSRKCIYRCAMVAGLVGIEQHGLTVQSAHTLHLTRQCNERDSGSECSVAQ